MARVIISGGGTGGHIFPAVSIAGELLKAAPDTEILFVGAEGRMEMEKVPAAGYKIVGLPVAGLQRRFTLKNLALPFKIIKSLRKAAAVIRNFKPDAVVGVGGYASAPVLWQAQRMHIPTLIQEQNSYAGLTNKVLGKKADAVCTAYEGMERFFPASKIIKTGNPIRRDLFELDKLRKDAFEFFGLNPDIKTVLVLGGSLGARTINESVSEGLQFVNKAGVQLIWQTGKSYIERARTEAGQYKSIKAFDFIYRMDYAFSAADIIVSRAGAGTISELCVVGKPAILVPSPNVSEDHQTKNAQALVNKNAAVTVADVDARNKLITELKTMINDNNLTAELSKNIKQMAMPDAGKVIAQKVLELAGRNKK